MKQLLATFFFLSIGYVSFAQVQENINVQRISFYHPTLGYNGDPTYFHRADEANDNTKLRLRLGDEQSGSFEIGYTNWENGLWHTAFSVNNAGDGYFRRNLAIKGRVGIGTESPGAKLEIFDSGNDLTILKLRNNEWQCNQSTAIEFWNGRLKSNATSRIVSKMDGCANDGEALIFETQSAGDSSPSEKLIIRNNGSVGIGTSSPGIHKLAVNGTIKAKEVKVTMVGWADFVFADDYVLQPLSEVEQHIKQHKHLPAIPSEAEVLENGIELGVMNAKLLQKIEELTLYTIRQEKKIVDQEKRLQEQQERFNQQQSLVELLLEQHELMANELREIKISQR